MQISDVSSSITRTPWVFAEMRQDDAELEGQPRGVHHAQNDTCGTGNQDKRDQNLAAAEQEAFPVLLAWWPSVTDHHEDHQTRGRIERSDTRRITEPEQKIHQDRDRQDEHPTDFEHIHHDRQICLGQPADAEPPGDGINLYEQYQEVEQGRDGRRDDDVLVGNFQEFRDDKGCCAHHRWRNLTAVRGDGFDGAAYSGLKPVFFISGIVTIPVDMILPTVDPEIVPKALEATTATLAGPPRRWPIQPMARSVRKRCRR